jgi:hypothetical protein
VSSDLWTVTSAADVSPAVVTCDVVTISAHSGVLRAQDLKTSIFISESAAKPVTGAPLEAPAGLLIAGTKTLRLNHSIDGAELA